MNRKNGMIIGIFLVALIVIGIIYQATKETPQAEIHENLQVVLPGVEISALYDDGTRLWVGSPEGIYWLDRDTGETIKKLDAKVAMIYAAMIAKTQDGLVWAGHDAGLSAFDAEGEEVIRITAPEIPGGRVNAILVLEEGFWIGTQEGAAFLAKEKDEWSVKEVLTTENGLVEEVVQVITKVGEEIWFGSYLAADRGGISIRSDKGWSYLTPEDGIPHRYINAILPLDENRVLIGSGQLIYGGLSLAERQDNVWKITRNWNQEDGIPGMKVRYLFLDGAKRLWITTEADGLLILDDAGKLDEKPLDGFYAKQENGLADDEIKCIVECDACFWLGGKTGLTRFGK